MADNLKATRPTGRRRRLKTFGEDRKCAHVDCETRISKYNSSDHCYAHTPRSYRRMRGVATDQS